MKKTKLTPKIIPVNISEDGVIAGKDIEAEIIEDNNDYVLRLKNLSAEQILVIKNGVKIVLNSCTEVALVTDFLDFSTPKRIINAPFADIKYIKVSDRNYTTYMDKQADIDSFNLFSWFIDKLPKRQFCRVHDSHIVNRKHIVKVITGKTIRLLMSDGERLTVSDTYKEIFLNWYKS